MFNIKNRTRTLLLLSGAVLLAFLLWFFLDIVIYILLSVILSFVGKPLMWALDRVRIGRFTIPKSIAAFISLVSLWLLFFGMFKFLIPLLIKEFETFSSIDLDQIFTSLQDPSPASSVSSAVSRWCSPTPPSSSWSAANSKINSGFLT